MAGWLGTAMFPSPLPILNRIILLFYKVMQREEN